MYICTSYVFKISLNWAHILLKNCVIMFKIKKIFFQEDGQHQSATHVYTNHTLQKYGSNY